jgi:hypothetical protein
MAARSLFCRIGESAIGLSAADARWPLPVMSIVYAESQDSK